MNNLLGNQMGMNPMGMNPMGMNPMGMNSMGMSQMSMYPTNQSAMGGLRNPPIPLWLLKWLTVFPFTGFLGFDHFALGSQFTGMTKLLVNMFTLGSWYAYDIVQVYFRNDLSEKGYRSPFFENGSVGKNNISTIPMENMDYNTKLWLYILYTCVFAFAYFITSRFISQADDILSVGYYYFNKLLFFGTLILAAFTLFYFLFFKSTPYVPMEVPLPNTNAKQTLRTSVGLPSQRASSSVVGKLLSGMSGGGDDNVRKMLQKVQNGGKKETYETNIFLLLLAILPIAGFTAYIVRKNKTPKKEDEISRNTRTV
jgi:hypothetical protein